MDVGQVGTCAPSFPLPPPRSPRVKNFPAKDALADKIEDGLSERAKGAEKAKGKRRQISPEINLLQQSDWSSMRRRGDG